MVNQLRRKGVYLLPGRSELTDEEEKLHDENGSEDWWNIKGNPKSGYDQWALGQIIREMGPASVGFAPSNHNICLAFNF
ncbi:hypothetical protein KY290_029380 [Solanum tuberosum]|uniref:Uncharacterized protein n=1 Tax=Solanum tuberosum TaxID=4113 RepID=A0ABQ7ULU4_SOLTU|nr:hypothetical protein KY290_029380 [Solanum tuberosum]